MKEVLDDIQVWRIRIPMLPRNSKIARGLQHFIYSLWLSVLTLFVPHTDVIMVVSPPLPLSLSVCLIGRIRRIPVVVNIQDLFPREAVELGMLTNPLLIRIFETMEKEVYRIANAITVHSPGNKEHLIQHGCKPENAHIVYNWVDTDHIQPGNKDNAFSRQHGLDGRFVVSYAGTMGWAQDMQTIVQCAAHLRDHKNILFLLVGDGVEKTKAQDTSQKLGLNNIIWLPMQPFSIYPEILSSSDVSLINLNPDLHTPVVPSKLLSIMSAGRPAVASLPIESDARRIIDESGCGFYVNASDSKALSDAILKVEQDRKLIDQLGERGRDYVLAHYSIEACTSHVEKILKHVAGEFL